MLSLLAACTSPGPRSDRHPDPTDPETRTGTGDTGAGTTAATGHTGSTAETGLVPSVDCSLLVAAADLTWATTSSIVTEEDFDFDGQGWLLTQYGNDLQGIDHDGVPHFVAANVGIDATGIRSTADGYVLVAQPSTGSIRLVDPTTGGSITLLSDLTNPNGLEAGEDGRMYFAENSNVGRVRSVDPTTGATEDVALAPWTNGIVLSPDDRTLYLASSASSFQPPTRIVSIDRADDGSWDASTMQVLYTHPDYVGSITIDACGNLYGLEYSRGRVFRLDTATLVAEALVDLPGVGSYSALHFSPGIDGWEVGSLYVTSRGELYEMPTGIPGSHVLTP